MIYLVESHEEALPRPGGDGLSLGVPAARYPHGLYLHLLDLTDEDVLGIVLVPPSRHRYGAPNGSWWFGDHAKACWPGTESGQQLHSERRPLHEILADRRR